MRYPHLFSPVSIRNLQLRNRIAMTAMHLGYTPEGEVTDRLTAFYRRRAQGGVGLIIVGGCPIDPDGGMPNMVRIDEDRFISGLVTLAGAVKAEGAAIAAQLYQAGRYTHSAMIGGRKPISASAVRSRLTGEIPRALDLEEIPRVQARFAEAAARAKAAGFDAVEVLGSAGYLISQFFSPLTNLREDAYGGSQENRMRFGIEVVEKVRAAVGPDYPILMRLAGNDFMEGGNTSEEAVLFARRLEAAGVDLFNVTGGWHETRVPQLTTYVPRRAYVYLASRIREAVGVPVLASNRINDPGVAEEILRTGQADMVTMARALIADPDLPRKALEGKEDRIFRCIACNQGCFDRIFQFEPAGCLVNPLAGLESEQVPRSPGRPRRVLIVGGGPAGLKAACTAAERGHAVTLVEREKTLGGQVLLNRGIPGREEFVTLVTDLVRACQALGVKVFLSRDADPAWIREQAPDVLVLATGAVPLVPLIPGVDLPHVVQAWDVLAGKKGLGRRVAVVGGNAVGLETAVAIAGQGTLPPEVLHFLMSQRAETPDTLYRLLDRGSKEVTVLEMTSRAGQDIGISTRWTVLAECKRLGVRVLTSAKVTAITPEGLTWETDGREALVPCDSVVLATGSRSEDRLWDLCRELAPEVHRIGDARQPRKALEAIREGFLLALDL